MRGALCWCACLLTAGQLLAEVPDARVSRQLAELKQHRHRRIAGLWELYRMGPAARSAIPALIKELYNQEIEDVPLVMSTLCAIDSQHKEVIRELSERTKYDTKAVKERAAYLLQQAAKRPGPARDSLFTAFGHDRELSAILLDLGAEPATELFERILGMEEQERAPWYRVYHVYSSQPYAPEIVDALRKQIASGERQRALLGLSVLQQFGAEGAGALPAIRQFLQAAQTAKERLHACTTLATVGSMGLLDIVRTVRDTQDVPTQIQLVSILEVLGPAARPASGTLRELADTTDSGILRARILSALRMIEQ